MNKTKQKRLQWFLICWEVFLAVLALLEQKTDIYLSFGLLPQTIGLVILFKVRTRTEREHAKRVLVCQKLKAFDFPAVS